MNATEFTAALENIKKQEEEECRDLRDRIDKSRRWIENAEKKLGAITAKYDHLSAELLQEFRGRKPASPESPAAETALPSRGQGQRIRRGSLNDPLLAMLREWKAAILTVPSVSDEWNRRHPELPVHRATIRGVLDRLEGPYLEVVDPGGVGSGNPRQWRLKHVSKGANFRDLVTTLEQEQREEQVNQDERR